MVRITEKQVKFAKLIITLEDKPFCIDARESGKVAAILSVGQEIKDQLSAVVSELNHVAEILEVLSLRNSDEEG